MIVRALTVAVSLAALGASAGCVELLEMDDPDATREGLGAVTTSAVEGDPSSLPSAPATVESSGPIVPGTPGLKVPRGYWTRVRIDEVDLMLGHTWLAAAEGEGMLMLRIRAEGEEAAPGDPPTFLRAVLPLALPGGTSLETLQGLELGEETLAGATISVSFGSKHTWRVMPERLVIEAVSERAVQGVLEGLARRGTYGKTERVVDIGFVAYRAPMPEPAAPGADRESPTPGAGSR